jgi:hypothetical protein
MRRDYSASLSRQWRSVRFLSSDDFALDAKPNQSLRFDRPFVLRTVRSHSVFRRPLVIACGWWRLLIAAVVAFQLNYIPLHLATAGHLDELLAGVVHSWSQPHGHDHDDEHDQHVPHPASDHELNLATRTTASLAFPAFCVVAETSVLVCEPESQPPLPIFDRIKPPGESPPDPRQPRAPPTV